ncbi:MAG: Hsp33 family molecular chaperone HslO [Fervidobacterium sp.]
MGRLVYGTAYNGVIRFSVIDSTDIVVESREKHNLSYLPTVVLGRLITTVGLVLPWLSEKETITFIISGDGPVESVVSQGSIRGTTLGTVRGYVSNKNFELEPNEYHKFDVKKAIGEGDLTVVRDVGLRTPYTSKVPLVSGEIAEDIAYYYTKSEQIPSAFALGVLMDQNGVISAGGLSVQVLDRNIDPVVIAKLEENLRDLSVSSLFTHMRLEEIASYVLSTDNMIYEEMDVIFKCNCNNEKAAESLSVLDLSELYQLYEEGKAEVTCKWCNTLYVFEKTDILKVIENKKRKVQEE